MEGRVHKVSRDGAAVYVMLSRITWKAARPLPVPSLIAPILRRPTLNDNDMAQPKTQPPMYRLPPELLLQIAGHLRAKSPSHLVS